MMVKKTIIVRCLILLVSLLHANCYNKYFSPNPSYNNDTTISRANLTSIQTSDSSVAADDIDFSDAFKDSTGSIDSVESVTQFSNSISPDSKNDITFQKTTYFVGTSTVRVCIKQNQTKTFFYSIGDVSLLAPKQKPLTIKGRGTVHITSDNHLEIVSLLGTKKISMPCTLQSKNEHNFIDIEKDSYRGSIIFVSEKKGFFSIVNTLDVEEYLRGVVPLEIGTLDQKAREALKAQAVAARTYTYKRILSRNSFYYDLYNTTADQVYGGANVEYRESDLAVRLTRNMIMVYNDTVVNAYYHSTCGGKTANIKDVWPHKPDCSYLHSITDSDSSGTIFCSTSKYFKWEENWVKDNSNNLICRNINVSDTRINATPPIRDIDIKEYFDCGRVRACFIKGRHWEYESGGDGIRKIFRRPVSGNPILRSSRFTIVHSNSNGLKITGYGHGHGVGLCQTGAIGRALAGQSYEIILKSYYSGIALCTATYK
jgi:SpoIID/LytB domain protein